MSHRALLIPGLVLVLVLGLGACVAPTPAPAPTQLPAEQPTEPVAQPEPEAVTLKVWDIMVRPEESAIMEELIARFQEANPGVTVTREAKNLDDLKATTGLALSSPDGPDVLMVNQGQSDMGALVAAGLLLPLDDYAAQYGWRGVFPDGLAALNSWTPDGDQMGEGNFYGMPIQAELVGVYYRTDLFEENGIEIPRTLAEFEAAMDTLKEAGVTPLIFGNLDGWPAIHLYSELQNAELGEREWYDDFMYLRNAVSFNQPANVAAAARLQEWIDKGYFNEGFAGIAYDDSWPIFSAGEGAMYLTGSWLAGELLAGPNADNFGFFLLPPLEEDGYKLSVGGTGLAFAIRHDTPNADLAAEYVDYLFSPETAEAMFTRGLLPVYPVDPALAQDRLSSDLVAAWAALNANNAVGYYMDWVTPTMYDTITASLQELMAKRLTPEEFVAKVDADYQAFLAEKAE